MWNISFFDEIIYIFFISLLIEISYFKMNNLSIWIKFRCYICDTMSLLIELYSREFYKIIYVKKYSFLIDIIKQQEGIQEI